MIDRDAALKTADRFVRQGRLDAAIAEYVRLVDDQPHDWNSINALGDLYLRAGDREHAVAQFTKVADHLYVEGFLSKAAALYKKSLKITPNDDHILWRLSDVAARQGLVVDAKGYLRQLASQRRESGDVRGEGECLVRLGRFDDADTEEMLVGARAAQALNDRAQALTLLRSAAEALQASGRTAEALDVVAEAATLDPAAAGHDPDVLLALGHRQLTSGRSADARSTLTRALAIAPDRYPEVVRIAQEIVASGRPDIGYGCIEVAVDAALLESEFDRAAAMLEDFLSHGQSGDADAHARASGWRHVPALRKLAGICRDAGFHDRQRIAEAQLQLINEFATGESLESLSTTHQVHAEPPIVTEQDIDELSNGIDRAIAAAAASRTPAPGGAEAPPDLGNDVARGLQSPGARIDEPEEPSGGTPDLESIFEQLRAHARHTPEGRAGGDEYARGLEALQRDDIDGAIEHLKASARAPLFRFNASARLGRLYATRNELATAVDWLERAAESPAPTADAGVAVLYDLAFTLQRMDETARALAVLLEVEADSPGYRDVRDRIAQLSKVQSRSSRA